MGSWNASNTHATGAQNPLMAKVTHTGENHGHLVFVHRLNDFFIPDGTAWLNHRSYPGADRRINAITKREEGIRGHYTALNGQIRFYLS